MDANERHHLKENDLAHILEQSASKWNDREFWAVWGNRILMAVLLISALALAYLWLSNRAAAAHEQMWSDLALAGSPETYDAVADSYTDPAVKSLALLRSADLLAARAASGQTITHQGDAASTQPSAVTSDPQQDARNAILRYDDVIAMPAASPLIRFNAMLGKASAHENLGQWDQARAMYEQVQQQAKEDSPILAARATNRLAILPRLDEPVVFAPDAPVAPADASASSDIPAPLPGLGTVPLPTNENQPTPQPEPQADAQPEAQPAAAPAASDTPSP